MTPKIKKLYKFSNSAGNMTYYVLSNCSTKIYVNKAMSYYRRHDTWSPVIDIISNEEYKVQRLLVEETDIDNLKDCARFMIETDVYCINNQNLKPRSRECKLNYDRNYYHSNKTNGLSAS